MSAKVIVRETDGTEYQLKARIGRMIVAAGFALNVERGVVAMISRPLSFSLSYMVRMESPNKLNPEGMPQCALATYPMKDQTSNPRPFGAAQDWAYFPVELRSQSPHPTV